MSQQFQSLEEAMHSMQLSENDRRDSARPTKPSKFDLSPPSPVKGHEQMYGHCASKKWVHELALRCVTKLHPELSYPCSNAAINTSYGIGKALRIHSLCTGSAFVPPGQIIPEEYMSEGYVFVLYICTDQLKSYRWRPTQKQVDELNLLVGREQQWWVDHVPLRGLEVE